MCELGRPDPLAGQGVSGSKQGEPMDCANYASGSRSRRSGEPANAWPRPSSRSWAARCAIQGGRGSSIPGRSSTSRGGRGKSCPTAPSATSAATCGPRSSPQSWRMVTSRPSRGIVNLRPERRTGARRSQVCQATVTASQVAKERARSIRW